MAGVTHAGEVVTGFDPNPPGLEDPRLAEHILRVIGALVVVLDRRGRIVRWNDGCAAATGWQAAEVVGQEFFGLLVPEEQRAEVRSVFAKLAAGDFPSQYENAPDGCRW